MGRREARQWKDESGEEYRESGFVGSIVQTYWMISSKIQEKTQNKHKQYKKEFG